MSRSATTAKACGWDVCVVAGWAYSKCTQGRLTLCGIWLKKWCLAICRQKQGRTKMSCCTCVAGNGVMSAIMATCCRRQLPNWWIAEPTMGVKKNSPNPRLMHMVFTRICQNSIDFEAAFFHQNWVIKRVRNSILYWKLQVILTVLFSKPSKRSRGFASSGMFLSYII